MFQIRQKLIRQRQIIQPITSIETKILKIIPPIIPLQMALKQMVLKIIITAMNAPTEQGRLITNYQLRITLFFVIDNS